MHGYECYQQINEFCVHNDLEGGSCGQEFVWRYPHTVVNSAKISLNMAVISQGEVTHFGTYANNH
jgi:hypothetical protein